MKQFIIKYKQKQNNRGKTFLSALGNSTAFSIQHQSSSGQSSHAAHLSDADRRILIESAAVRLLQEGFKGKETYYAFHFK
jgi:hypothetical protein